MGLTDSVNEEEIMNESFFSLPEEKRQKIINAGYRVFSRNSYRKSPMSEIADAAGISKSLLFYYFRNKKELYLFLWNTCATITQEYLEAYHCREQENFFDAMDCGLKAKVRLMEEYPDMSAFVIKAFYEKDPAVADAVQKSYRQRIKNQSEQTARLLDPRFFKPGLDIKMMYREMFLASEGYLWEAAQRGDVNAKQLEKDFTKMLDFWKSIYGRNEETT